MKKHASRTLTSVPFFRPQRKQTRNDDDRYDSRVHTFFFIWGGEAGCRLAAGWSPGMRVGKTDWTGCWWNVCI